MYKTESTMKIDTTKEKMWDIWTDIPNWNQWITSVEFSSLDGNFENGTKGSMKLANGSKSTFTLAECVKNESFICRSKFLFCTIDAGHEMTEEDDKIKVKLYAKVSGPLAFILKYAVKKEAKGIPTALEKLDELSKE